MQTHEEAGSDTSKAEARRKAAEAREAAAEEAAAEKATEEAAAAKEAAAEKVAAEKLAAARDVELAAQTDLHLKALSGDLRKQSLAAWWGISEAALHAKYRALKAANGLSPDDEIPEEKKPKGWKTRGTDYDTAISNFNRAVHVDKLDRQTRSNLGTMAEHREDIEACLKSLPLNEQVQNHPSTVVRDWKDGKTHLDYAQRHCAECFKDLKDNLSSVWKAFHAVKTEYDAFFESMTEEEAGIYKNNKLDTCWEDFSDAKRKLETHIQTLNKKEQKEWKADPWTCYWAWQAEEAAKETQRKSDEAAAAQAKKAGAAGDTGGGAAGDTGGGAAGDTGGGAAGDTEQQGEPEPETDETDDRVVISLSDPADDIAQRLYSALDTADSDSVEERSSSIGMWLITGGVTQRRGVADALRRALEMSVGRVETFAIIQEMASMAGANEAAAA